VQFGHRLLLARGRAGLTQQALGAPDLSKSFISLLESGRSHPSVETVVSLARRVDSSIGALLLDPADLRRETALNLLHLASQMDLASQGMDALKLADAADALLPDMPAELRARSALLRARAAIGSNALEEAARWADQALATAKQHRYAVFHAMALALKGEVEVRRRTYRNALPMLEEATEKMQRTKAARTEENVRALISLGTTRAQLGQVDRAHRAFRRALELSTRLRVFGLRGKALTGLGLVAWTRKQLDSAVTLLTQAHEAFAQVEDLQETSRVLSNLGLVRREQGRLSDALAALEQALRVRERISDPRGRSATLDELAQVHLALNQHADAARAARRAIKEAQAGDDRAREALAQATLGRVLRAQGRRREAIELLRGAVATLKRLGLEDQAAAAAGDLGLMLREAGDDAEAARYLTIALKTAKAPEPSAASPAALLKDLAG
jgi:tetratricopeptide (TPR) repeat protein